MRLFRLSSTFAKLITKAKDGWNKFSDKVWDIGIKANKWLAEKNIRIVGEDDARDRLDELKTLKAELEAQRRAIRDELKETISSIRAEKEKALRKAQALQGANSIYAKPIQYGLEDIARAKGIYEQSYMNQYDRLAQPSPYELFILARIEQLMLMIGNLGASINSYNNKVEQYNSTI